MEPVKMVDVQTVKYPVIGWIAPSTVGMTSTIALLASYGVRPVTMVHVGILWLMIILYIITDRQLFRTRLFLIATTRYIETMKNYKRPD